MKSKVILSVAALLGVGVSPAQSMIMEVTYTGTVSSGYDSAGIFGDPGQNITGDSYSATFVFDPEIGRIQSSNSDYARGGAYMGTGSPMLESTVTINGKTQIIYGGYYSSVYAASLASGFSEMQQVAQDYNDGKLRSIDSTIFNTLGTFPISLTAPFGPYAVRSTDTVRVIVDFDNLDAFGGNSLGRDAYALIDISMVTISAVPELTTSVMLFLGFAGLGFMAYRQAKSAGGPLRA